MCWNGYSQPAGQGASGKDGSMGVCCVWNGVVVRSVQEWQAAARQQPGQLAAMNEWAIMVPVGPPPHPPKQQLSDTTKAQQALGLGGSSALSRVQVLGAVCV